MKKLEIIIRPDRLETLKLIFNKISIGGMTVTSVMGCGNQKGVTDYDTLKGLKVYGMNLIPKIEVKVVVQDEEVNRILSEIQSQIATGKVGDGKVFVTDVEDCMRIRTGERGRKSI